MNVLLAAINAKYIHSNLMCVQLKGVWRKNGFRGMTKEIQERYKADHYDRGIYDQLRLQIRS